MPEFLQRGILLRGPLVQDDVDGDAPGRGGVQIGDDRAVGQSVGHHGDDLQGRRGR